MKFVASYYKVRNLCHAVKDNNAYAIEISAKLLAQKVMPNDIIVPMPSHNGKATYMLTIANQMSNLCGCKVMDILSSTPHETWYDTKKRHGEDVKLNYSFQTQQGNLIGHVYIIDNVYSTGQTMKAAITQLKKNFPTCKVDGLTIGIVDAETNKRLYNKNNVMFESRNKYPSFISKNSYDFSKNDDFMNFCNRKWSKRRPMLHRDIEKFICNLKEGGNLRQPSIKSAAKNTQTNEPYLRFNRYKGLEDKGCNTIALNAPIVDFNYLSEIIKLFAHIDINYSTYFEYKNGELTFTVYNSDHYKKDEQGNKKIGNNGFPQNMPCRQIDRTHPIKSNIGFFKPHNHNGLSLSPEYRGNYFDKYFHPIYCLYGANGELEDIAHSNQTGGGQFPINWFPKKDDGSGYWNDCLMKIAQTIIVTLSKTRNPFYEALFVTFLDMSNNGQIVGYDYYSNSQLNDLLYKVNCKLNNEYNHQKQPNVQNSLMPTSARTMLIDEPYDLYGNDHDEDMEYQISHLGIESIVRNTINDFILECKKGFV